eukprot:TRINITY_DN51089_c0_g1_i1.p1 TRINITY_DN51089_c0_g1~~TRINITY_DN51089_c0_g1_i1.p1  ORF type:complete len:304 (-),score=57.16 TRINITY_DN51089_c0_g1_i1:29-898(-)
MSVLPNGSDSADLLPQKAAGDDLSETESTASASEEHTGTAPPPLDFPLLAAEVSAALLGILGFLILFAGVGFFTVKPPGEEDLCRPSTLGLQNLTQGRQQLELAACHALYTGAFNMLGLISIPFILSGSLALGSAAALFSAVRRPGPEKSQKMFCHSATADVFGTIIVWIPSIYFPGLTVLVAAGLAPIHAYFISIMMGHFAISASDAAAGSDGVGIAAYTYEILYQGYCAASRLELCLTIGSFSMLLVFWVFLFDFCRNLMSMSCWRPRYDQQAGYQVLRLLKRYMKG